MILKIEYKGAKGWLFYDRVKSAKVRAVLHDPKEPLGDDEIDLLSEDRDPKLEVGQCSVVFDDGSHQIFYFDEAYLLNNDGKTIERL